MTAFGRASEAPWAWAAGDGLVPPSTPPAYREGSGHREEGCGLA